MFGLETNHAGQFPQDHAPVIVNPCFLRQLAASRAKFLQCSVWAEMSNPRLG